MSGGGNRDQDDLDDGRTGVEDDGQGDGLASGHLVGMEDDEDDIDEDEVIDVAEQIFVKIAEQIVEQKRRSIREVFLGQIFEAEIPRSQ